MNRTRSIGALLLVAAVAVPAAALAASYRSSDTVTVPEGETLHDDMYAAGGTITVDGTLDGDLVAVGSTVTVNGTVTGDIIAAGGTVTIAGTAKDDVRIAGGTLELRGAVGDDLLAAGGTVSLEAGSSVGGDTKLAGNTVKLAGTVNSVNAAAGQQLSLAATAVVRGDLRYAADRDLDRAAGARVQGAITRRDLQRHASSAQRALESALAALGTVLFAGLLYLLFPRALAAMPTAGGYGASLLAGLAAFVIGPIACIALMASGIGTPAGIALILALPLLGYAGWLTGALALGSWLASRLGLDGASAPWGWAALGGISLGLITLVPVLGPIMALLTALFGSGYLLRAIPRGGRQA